MSSKKKNNSDSFDAYYREQFPDCWDKLREALLAPKHHYKCLSCGLTTPYYLDFASYEAALALTIEENDTVLDMCSAPGGKALAIALLLKKNCKMICNEISLSRRKRLEKVISTIEDRDIASCIKITPYDATQFGLYRPCSFTKILLDAPCSSEAHVLSSTHHYNIWSPHRIKMCAQKQFSLLASAYDALKAGGTIIYSTCALLPSENDEVVKRLCKKRDGVILDYFEEKEHQKAKNSFGYYTKHGIQIMPTLENRVGPIYYAKIQKSL